MSFFVDRERSKDRFSFPHMHSRPCVRHWLFLKIVTVTGGVRGVMVIVVGNGHGDTSSNPGRD